jgi:predicted phage gp36 major capsid-like protein
VAKEISGSPVVNVDLVFQRDGAAEAAGERNRQRIEALQSVLARVNKRIEQLKADSADAVNAALTKKIEALEKTISEKAGARKEIEEEINLWKAEIIIKPPKATVKKPVVPGSTS